MPGLDEVSSLIGELRADVRNVGRMFDDHEKRDQERFDMLRDDIKSISPNAVRVSRIETQLKRIEPIVNNIEKMSWTLGGLVLGLGAFGGVVGPHVYEALKWIFLGA